MADEENQAQQPEATQPEAAETKPEAAAEAPAEESQAKADRAMCMSSPAADAGTCDLVPIVVLILALSAAARRSAGRRPIG